MKMLLTICLGLFASYSSLLHASSINVLSSSGAFIGNSSSGLSTVAPLSNPEMASNLSDNDLATYFYGATMGGTVSSAELTLSFQDTVLNQAGADIAFYFISGSTNNMDICISNECKSLTASTLDPLTVSFGGDNYALSAIAIDLSAFGLLDNEALGQFTIDLISGGQNRLAGIETLNNVSAVPVPAAIWLFITGLGALGVISRRRVKH